MSMLAMHWADVYFYAPGEGCSLANQRPCKRCGHDRSTIKQPGRWTFACALAETAGYNVQVALIGRNTTASCDRFDVSFQFAGDCCRGVEDTGRAHLGGTGNVETRSENRKHGDDAGDDDKDNDDKTPKTTESGEATGER